MRGYRPCDDCTTVRGHGWTTAVSKSTCMCLSSRGNARAVSSRWMYGCSKTGWSSDDPFGAFFIRRFRPKKRRDAAGHPAHHPTGSRNSAKGSSLHTRGPSGRGKEKARSRDGRGTACRSPRSCKRRGVPFHNGTSIGRDDDASAGLDRGKLGQQKESAAAGRALRATL